MYYRQSSHLYGLGQCCFFPIFSEWSISKQNTQKFCSTDYRKCQSTLAHLILYLVCNNAQGMHMLLHAQLVSQKMEHCKR